ncbi:TIGR02444 family protein [Vreelandella stevensii]|uniref:TIGR02444 family protein n=1 Tax=Vreelandella stevensii TaxID=502821 RepID=UPI00403AD5C8
MDSNRLQDLQQALQHRSLWDFALAFYAQPGVEQACLTLQDAAEVDVCELLFHGWLYCHGLQAKREALADISRERAHWQGQFTEPLRHLRRELKPQAAEDEAIDALRKSIKAAELQAERVNLQRWQQWAQASDHVSRRLVEIDDSQLDVSIWLQNQLFLANVDSASLSDSRVRDGIASALECLASQLDHCKSPR